MPYCCVSYCYNNTGNGSRLFPLPQGKKNETRRKQWLQNINRYDLPLNSFICEDHFTEDQFHDEGADGIRPLKHNAVPTIFSEENKLVVKPVKKKEISLESIKQENNKQVMCRTCFSYKSKHLSFLMTKFINGKTVKDLMLRLVPQMAHTITDESYICNKCMTSLSGSLEFIDTCLEIETKIKNGQLIYDAAEVLRTDDKESAPDVKEKIVTSLARPQIKRNSSAVLLMPEKPQRLVRIIPIVKSSNTLMEQTSGKKRGRKPIKKKKGLKTFSVVRKNTDQNSSISQKDSEIGTEESVDSDMDKINSPELETIVVKGEISNDTSEEQASEKNSKKQDALVGLRSSKRIRTRRRLEDCAEEKEIDEFLKENCEDEGTFDDQEIETPKRRKRRDTDDSVEDKDYETEQLIASPKRRRKRKDVGDVVEGNVDAYCIRMEKIETAERETSPVLRVIHNPMKGTIRTYERKKKIVTTENISVTTENSLVTTENILITTENTLVTTENSLTKTENSLAKTEDSLVSKDPESSVVDSQKITNEQDEDLKS